MKLIYLLLIISLPAASFAQFQVKGNLKDTETGEAVIAATVQLFQDSVSVANAFSEINGDFLLSRIKPGSYQLTISFVGYEKKVIPVEVKNSNLDLGVLPMAVASIVTQEVQVTARQVRVEMKGDTTQFNADAYKVNPDATAEDLVRKMPGIEVENGQVKAQGEAVKRVLIDGKEFFGEDPSAALKNLPAEIIAKIEVFDRQSDQAQFSGFDDGQTEKTINIVTRSGKSNGEFGKVYAGGGTEDHYSAGLNMNYFTGDRRISIIGMSNNINIQNFATEDLLGALGNSGGGRGGRGGGQGGFGGNSTGNFLVGSQGGITQTNALGLNYIDKWGKKLTISGSYFFNQSENTQLDSLERTTFISNDQNQYYSELNNQQTTNLNHRINARITYDIDKSNSIIFTPSVSFQSTGRNVFFDGFTLDNVGNFINTIASDQNTDRNGYNFRGNVLYRHRFGKQGRTFSVGVGSSGNENRSTGDLYSENVIYREEAIADLLNQTSSSLTDAMGFNFRADYTEPLSANSQLQFSYSGNFSRNNSDKSTFDVDPENENLRILSPVLSNTFANGYDTHTETISYRYNKRGGLMFNTSINVQQALLNSEQLFPVSGTIDRQFFNVLPFAMLRYNFTQSKNIRLFYRSNTNAPSISQLQNVVDNSNPLQLRAGNPELDQQVSHSLTLRYNSTNIEKATSFYAFLSGGLTDNNISNSIFTAAEDTLFRGVLLARGSQLTLPVNYGQAWQSNAFITYGFPLKPIKSNLNFNLGTTFAQSPSLSNGLRNVSDNFRVSSGLVIGSNVSENIDFTLAYNGAYNWISYSLNPGMNSNYYSQTLNGKLNLLSKKGLLLNVEGVNMLYSGLGEGFDQNYTLVNAAIGQKLFKKRNGELKLSVFDLLNQNTSVNRNATNAYLEDSRSLVLNRYYMLTFTLNIRNFRGAKVTEPANDNPGGPWGGGGPAGRPF